MLTEDITHTFFVFSVQPGWLMQSCPEILEGHAYLTPVCMRTREPSRGKSGEHVSYRP